MSLYLNELPPIAPKLSRIARQSEAWLELVAIMKYRLESYRTRLEKESDQVETERLRGRIEEIRSMLSLEKERERLEADANLGF